MELKISSNGPLLRYSVRYNQANQQEGSDIELSYSHTFHSFRRASQRGILGDKIAAVLEYGDSYYKQGFLFYVLGEKNIPDSMAKERKKLKNTVVVVCADSNVVITCYRNKNAHHHIKLKSKRLARA